MNKRGQSIIEYTLIAILVILGIVYMGPYALRSVNGYFKLWDASVQDSFEENMSQAPISDIPDLPTNCACTSVDQGCGGGCKPGYHSWTYSCSLQSCNYAVSGNSSCVADCNCCAAIQESCGTFPLPAQNASNGTVPSGDPPIPPGTILTNCYFGQRLWSSPCPSSTSCPACSGSVTKDCIPSNYCQKDTTGMCKGPTCTGSLPPGTVYCSWGGNLTVVPSPSGLDQNYPTTPATGGTGPGGCPSNSSTVPNCQYTCDNGVSPNPADGSCGYTVAPAPIIGTTGATCPTSMPLTCSCSQTAGPVHTTLTTVTCSTGTYKNPNNWCGANPIATACSIAEYGGTSCTPQGTGCTNMTPCGCGTDHDATVPSSTVIPGTQCSVQYTFSTP